MKLYSRVRTKVPAHTNVGLVDAGAEGEVHNLISWTKEVEVRLDNGQKVIFRQEEVELITEDM